MASTSGGSKGGARDVHPHLSAKISSFSCSFWEKLWQIVGWRPPLRVGAPPLGNPESVTVDCILFFYKCHPVTWEYVLEL